MVFGVEGGEYEGLLVDLDFGVGVAFATQQVTGLVDVVALVGIEARAGRFAVDVGLLTPDDLREVGFRQEA